MSEERKHKVVVTTTISGGGKFEEKVQEYFLTDEQLEKLKAKMDTMREHKNPKSKRWRLD